MMLKPLQLLPAEGTFIIIPPVTECARDPKENEMRKESLVNKT